MLRYEIANNFPARLAVVGEFFMRVDYVFAFPLGSDMRKQVNRVILSYIETDEWRIYCANIWEATSRYLPLHVYVFACSSLPSHCAEMFAGLLPGDVNLV